MLEANFLLSLLAAIAICSLLLLKLPRVAIHIGLTDNPDGRKHHEGNVPLIGGIAMFSGAMFALLLLDLPLGTMRGFFAGSALLIIIGILDDLHELSSAARFIAQILAAIFMAEWGDVRLVDLGWISPSGELVQLNWWSSLLTVFATVGVINALNMIDGIDGLAGTIALIAIVSMGVLTYTRGDVAMTKILCIFAAVIIVFLFFNRHVSHKRWHRIFMGDAGSMFLGFVLCWFFIHLSQGDNRLIAPVTALWIFFIPLIDTVTQMFRRILKGRSPFSADRTHMHHILLARGLPDNKTYATLITISLVTACIGIWADMNHFSQATMFYSFLGCFAVYFVYACCIKKIHHAP